MDNNQNKKSKNPVWFRILNLAFVLPVIIWPLIFFSTIFFFDNPKNYIVTVFVFLLVNAYPLYLLGFLLLNAKLFRKRKMIATILPIAFGVTFLFCSLKFVGGFDNLSKLKAQIKENKQAPIDKSQLCCGFTKDSNNIYYYDKLLKNVDIKSFEIINFNWAKDTNVVYYNGNPISYIDKKSFQYLDYHYAIDTKNVYYDTVIISGADALTFKHIEGTQDGKDKNNCYRYGKQVDCKVLLTEE